METVINLDTNPEKIYTPTQWYQSIKLQSRNFQTAFDGRTENKTTGLDSESQT